MEQRIGDLQMGLSDLNVNLFRMINDLGKEYESLNPSMVLIAEYTLYFLILSVFLFLFSKNKRNRLMVICGTFTVSFAEILGKLAGLLHSNNPPFAELEGVNKLIEKGISNSFPSDHTMIIFSLCVSFWLFKRGWSFLWIVLACLVGFSRIWVGVHYPADVIVGAGISIIAALIVYKFVPQLGFMKKRFGSQTLKSSNHIEL